MKNKTEKNAHVEFLRGWANATVEKLIEMEKEGKSKNYRKQYLELSIHAGEVADAIVGVDKNTDDVLKILTREK